jgi:hypothetical protein
MDVLFLYAQARRTASFVLPLELKSLTFFYLKVLVKILRRACEPPKNMWTL